jgi:hypothetical protein
MDIQTFNKQEEVLKKYWNELVYKEISNIYFELYKTEINFSPNVKSENLTSEIKQKRKEQTEVVNYWRQHYSKFRLINDKIVLLRLEHSGWTIFDGFYAEELSISNATDVMNALLNDGILYSKECDKLKKREGYLIGGITISLLVICLQIYI